MPRTPFFLPPPALPLALALALALRSLLAPLGLLIPSRLLAPLSLLAPLTLLAPLGTSTTASRAIPAAPSLDPSAVPAPPGIVPPHWHDHRRPADVRRSAPNETAPPSTPVRSAIVRPTEITIPLVARGKAHPARVRDPADARSTGQDTVPGTPRWQWPVRPAPKVLRGFEPPAHPWEAGHRGIDLAAAPDQSVYAAGPGRVGFARDLAGRGVVTVVHGTLRTTYLPVEPTVHTGQLIAAGARIGRVEAAPLHCPGTPCLHWGLLRGVSYLDPLTLLGLGPVRLLPWWDSGGRLPAADDPPSGPQGLTRDATGTEPDLGAPPLNSAQPPLGTPPFVLTEPNPGTPPLGSMEPNLDAPPLNSAEQNVGTPPLGPAEPNLDTPPISPVPVRTGARSAGPRPMRAHRRRSAPYAGWAASGTNRPSHPVVAIGPVTPITVTAAISALLALAALFASSGHSEARRSSTRRSPTRRSAVRRSPDHRQFAGDLREWRPRPRDRPGRSQKTDKYH